MLSVFFQNGQIGSHGATVAGDVVVWVPEEGADCVMTHAATVMMRTVSPMCRNVKKLIRMKSPTRLKIV